MNKDYLDIISAISLLIGILGGIFFGIKTLYKSFKTAQRKRREQLIGRWTNEGSVNSTESHYMRISLDVDFEDGEVTGLLEYVRNLRDDEEHKDVSLNGNFFWRSIELRMSIVKQGEVFDCGYLKIKRVNHKQLKLVPKPVMTSYFPKEATLWKI